MGAIIKKYVCTFFLFSVIIPLFSQESIERFEAPQNNKSEKEEVQVYDQEFTYGLQWATNGGILAGFAFKYAWQHKYVQTRYHLIGLDLVHVEHPKEVSTRGEITNFTFGKSADILCIRPHYGQEFILFHKAAEEGIQVSFIGAVGPTLAYRKPYMIYYNIAKEDRNDLPMEIIEIQFNESLINSRVKGNAGPFSGFGDMTAHLGIHTKTSLNFEYGKFERSVVGIEIGMITELFSEKMMVMPYIPEQNKQLFFSLFTTIYYGLR